MRPQLFKPTALFFVLALLLASCNKDKEIIIPDNVPPPDRTIDSTTIDIYVDKVYISLLGREALGAERTNAKQVLKQHNFSVDDRKQFLNSVTAQPEFKKNLYKVARAEYLQSADSSNIAFQRDIYASYLTLPQYQPFYDVLQYEVGRLNQLLAVDNDFSSGAIDVRGMHKRCVNNNIYDQINMGTENFVVSTFQNFFFRYPTQSELEAGKKMVDGTASIFFLQTGSSKADYLNIFFNTTDYFEGQVRYIYSRYLFREATSAEMSYYANLYKGGSGYGYNTLIKEILSGNEYAGVR